MQQLEMEGCIWSGGGGDGGGGGQKIP
jgi:hypothetical protein